MGISTKVTEDLAVFVAAYTEKLRVEYPDAPIDWSDFQAKLTEFAQGKASELA